MKEKLEYSIEESKKIIQHFKRKLKFRSKSELITIIVTQANKLTMVSERFEQMRLENIKMIDLISKHGLESELKEALEKSEGKKND